ncbi:MAG: type II toxin-antitoxin system VapC family toxin [Synergistaceae bacterium]|nr:type II toxin-antitoxin system VapC family toxin [Synergistaceae bacterium]
MIWLLTEDPKLPEKVAEMTKSKGNTTFFSSVSMWEIAIKRLVHPDKITGIPIEKLVVKCEDANICELCLQTEHTFFLETLTRPEDAPPHKDPFDRILISQAKSEGMTFLTHDDLLPYYNEPCILYV